MQAQTGKSSKKGKLQRAATAGVTFAVDQAAAEPHGSAKSGSPQHHPKKSISVPTGIQVPAQTHDHPIEPVKKSRSWSIFGRKQSRARASSMSTIQHPQVRSDFIRLVGLDGGSSTNDEMTNLTADRMQSPVFEMHNKLTGSRVFLVDRSDSGLASTSGSAISLFPSGSSISLHHSHDFNEANELLESPTGRSDSVEVSE